MLIKHITIKTTTKKIPELKNIGNVLPINSPIFDMSDVILVTNVEICILENVSILKFIILLYVVSLISYIKHCVFLANNIDFKNSKITQIKVIIK